mmetsp:Transcript_71717/g.154837  ORF Transcript_71717/g.154837 Transcript_71717/m.154837 type:complete len:1095 (+) Transcript_71717:168-3452(+)
MRPSVIASPRPAAALNAIPEHRVLASPGRPRHIAPKEHVSTDYYLTGILAVGGRSSQVVRGIRKEDHEKVAIKSIRRDLLSRRDVTNMNHAIRIQAAIEHANVAELKELVAQAFVNSPQVIVDKSLKGWKELEYEVVRDANDNCITVCNMENFDPMGIHTGDSIVIAPSQTLTNAEYFRLRECAQKVVRHIGVVGECNIQYAVDPHSQEFRIIEVNARLSRSSALASKATGYPLAYVAAKLALGSDLVKLRNSVTKCTTACFEPSLDYIVAKVPRWDLRKFATVDPAVGSCMKSVGEVMAIGRTFEEVIQKALRMVDESCAGFDAERFDSELMHRGVAKDEAAEKLATVEELSKPTPIRIWAIAKAFELGMSVEDVHQNTAVDRWFLTKLHHIHTVKKSLRGMEYADLRVTPLLLKEAKRCGFADRQIANQLRPVDLAVTSPDLRAVVKDKDLVLGTETYAGGRVREENVRHLRKRHRILPVVKQIDTLAAEFPAETNYLYLTYSGEEHDIELASLRKPADKRSPTTAQFSLGPSAEPRFVPHPRTEQVGEGAERTPPVIVLGCGCYRIGSSVEFDWCSVSCIRTLRSFGHEAVVINCNPETVSTDFDASDRLYFEELSHEVVLDIAELEQPMGVVVSVGGQTPNNLAMGLSKHGVNILGTSVDAIDACENRFKFSSLCDAMRIDQPEWSEFSTVEEAFHFCKRSGYPALVRPSYVLSGAAMRVVNSDADLERFLRTAAVVSRDYPVVISKYISGAKEVELDAVGQNGEMLNYAIAEHVENAGVHSGDASLLLPAQKLFVETHRRVKNIGQKLCRALKISGPFNLQFMCKDNEVMVIECNLRASRSLPFISKTYNVDFIELATRVMLGMKVKPAVIQPMEMDIIASKVPVFSFSRLKNSDPRLGVEMQSTGEVACFGVNQYDAFLKAMISGGLKLPVGPGGASLATGVLISLGPQDDKKCFAPYVALLAELGHTLYATSGTHAYFESQSITCKGKPVPITMLHNAVTQKEPNVTNEIKAKTVKVVITTPSSRDSGGATAGYFLRRRAMDGGMALIVDIRQAMKLVDALYQKYQCEQSGQEFWSIESWHESHRIG